MTKKVLVIDDEAAVAEMIKLTLEHSGYTAIVLQSSKNAITAIKKELPDIILLDVTMPHKDGYQVCDEVRCDLDIQNIPIIMFTAQPLEKDFIEKAHTFYGATDYILKPFEPEQLLSKIEHLISK